MGTWNCDSFGNDDAMDWLRELAESGGQEMIAAAVANVADSPAGEEIDSDVCRVAIVAAELLAAQHGKPGSDLPDDALRFLEAHAAPPQPPLLEAARRALDRIRTASELRELYQESDSLAEWLAALDSVKSRLA